MATPDEWVAKAEGDYAAAVQLNRPRKRPVPDAVCYHCQQCAEKYLKAYLVSVGVDPPYIHDLVQLLRACAAHDPDLVRWMPEARYLTQYAWVYRYPGSDANDTEAREAVHMLRRLRLALRRRLGL